MNTCMECGALYARDECPVCWVRLAVRALYQRDAPLEPDEKREPEGSP